VRQLFKRGGGKPVVVATLLDDPDANGASLEFLNEGGPANAVECLAQVVGRLQHVTIGTLATGETKSVAVGPVQTGVFRCVWACSDAGGRTHIWSYDGRRRRLGRRRRTALQDVFDEMYPAPRT
jgi:YD repeat-containing protein